MERNIFDIGSGKYIFDAKTLESFIEEAKNRSHGAGENGLPESFDPAEVPSDWEMQCVFDEVMALYHDFMLCQSVELLVRLKCRLEEVSIRYKSHILAEEVLTINSCLPYEQRIFNGSKVPR